MSDGERIFPNKIHILKNHDEVYLKLENIYICEYHPNQGSINTALAAWNHRGGPMDLARASLGSASQIGGMVFMFVYRPLWRFLKGLFNPDDE